MDTVVELLMPISWEVCVCITVQCKCKRGVKLVLLHNEYCVKWHFENDIRDLKHNIGKNNCNVIIQAEIKKHGTMEEW